MYDDMIVDAPEDGKPWFVLFGKTPYSNQRFQQPTDAMLKSFACMAAEDDELNYAFMDFSKSEKTREVYDDIGQYGTMAPYTILFHKGKAYHYG